MLGLNEAIDQLTVCSVEKGEWSCPNKGIRG